MDMFNFFFMFLAIWKCDSTSDGLSLISWGILLRSLWPGVPGVIQAELKETRPSQGESGNYKFLTRTYFPGSQLWIPQAARCLGDQTSSILEVGSLCLINGAQDDGISWHLKNAELSFFIEMNPTHEKP
jgi:hypothetical protein